MKLNDRTMEFDGGDIKTNKLYCGLSYLGILFFLPLVCCADSSFGKFHANQSLVLLVLSVLVGVAINVLAVIFTAIGLAVIAVILHILSALVYIPLVVLYLIGLITAFQGKAIELPFIGAVHWIK